MRSELIEARKQKGMKQSDVASLIPVAPGYYNEIERGVKNCSLKVAARIEEILGVPVKFKGRGQS